MNRTTASTLTTAALRSITYLVQGDIRFPTDRLGYVLERQTGDRFTVYRETTRTAPPPRDPADRVVLVFTMQLADPAVDRGLRRVLANPLANVATPFYAGMPGFRRKLWLAGENTDELLELYEFASHADASRFVDALQSLLAPFDAMGEATYEIVEDDTVDQYVASRTIRWHRPTTRRRRPPASGIGLVLLALLVAAAAALAFWRRTRTH